MGHNRRGIGDAKHQDGKRTRTLGAEGSVVSRVRCPLPVFSPRGYAKTTISSTRLPPVSTNRDLSFCHHPQPEGKSCSSSIKNDRSRAQADGTRDLKTVLSTKDSPSGGGITRGNTQQLQFSLPNLDVSMLSEGAKTTISSRERPLHHHSPGTKEPPLLLFPTTS